MVKSKNGFDNSKPLQRFSESLVKQKQDMGSRREEQDNSRWVELFFSFDVVNSSVYKTINYFGWSSVLSLLFHKIQKHTKSLIPEAELWRVLGDEVIFVARVEDESDIHIFVEKVFEILIKMIGQIKSGKFFEELSSDCAQRDVDLMKLQNVISLKGAAWIAIITKDGNKELKPYDNIFEKYRAKDDYEINEYLGNDIDTGFRIKNKTEDRRLVVSYELAYLLSSRTDSLSCLNIVAYDTLRGIWDGDLYPIIWYHNPKIYHSIEFRDSFYYSEREQSEIVRRYLDNEPKFKLDEFLYKEVKRALDKIKLDRNLTEKLETIREHIVSKDQINKGFSPSFLLQLHCVAVCYRQIDNRILIMKRSKERDKFPNKWDFGCAKANKGTSLSEQIEKEYKSDLGIDIEVVLDDSREDRQPIPIALYQIPEDECHTHKGIITIAIINDSSKICLDKRKYSKSRWIAESEVENFEESAIPDFKNTLKKVFKAIKEIN